MLEGHDLAVHLGADTMVSDFGVNRVNFSTEQRRGSLSLI